MHGSPSILSDAAVTVSLSLPVTASELSRRLEEAIAAAAERGVAQKLVDERVISLAEATAMTPWTENGFKRVADRENVPWIKGPHKATRGYKLGAVIAMLDRLQVWPHGRPVEAFKAVA